MAYSGKKLKIAQVAPLWFAIPPKKYGGVERIVHFLSEELVRRGHEVTLFASGDTKTSARLVAGWPKSLFRERLYKKPIRWGHCVFPLFNFSAAFERARDFDIIQVHENNTCLSNFFTKFTDTPVVTTVHDPFPLPRDKDRWAVFRKYRGNNYIALSRSHKNLAKNLGINFAGVVYNGIDINDFAFKGASGTYLAWLGRFDPNKGAREAILAAQKLKMPLRLAGRVDINSPVAKEYFFKEIQPRLNPDVRYIGEVGDKEKVNFLRNAKALLYPISWNEPFGLVMAEAQACGTPVIAFNRGSVPEVVVHNKTGYVVRNLEEMVGAVRVIGRIDRRACRKWAEENFTIPRMVDSYEKVYRKIIRHN